MYKKKIIIITCLLILLGITFAIEENQIITQNQLDNLNLETINLNCVHNNTFIKYDGQWLIIVDYNCNRLKKLVNGNYSVYREDFLAQYPIRQILSCYDQFNKTYCIEEELIPELQEQIQTKKLFIRREAKNWQSWNIDLDLENDINLII